MAIVKSTNISLAEVRDILNNAGGSVDNDLTTFFTDSAKLNMWSKYKPVVATELFLDTAKRWQGESGMCGLTIPNYVDAVPFANAAMSGDVMWHYTPPKGGTTEPRRLGDFRGYCSDAVNPLGGVASNGILSDGKVRFAIDVALSGTSDTNLMLTDISVEGYNGAKLSEYYLGILAWKGSKYVMRTGLTKIGAVESLEVEIPISETGDWMYMPFLAKTIQGENAQSGKFLSINKPAQKLTVKASTSIKEAYGYGAWNAAFTKVTEISVFLSNDSSSATTFTNIRVWLVRSKGTVAAEGETVAGTTVSYGSSVSVAAKGTAWISMGDINHGKSSEYFYWIACASDQSTTTYNEIEEQVQEG